MPRHDADRESAFERALGALLPFLGNHVEVTVSGSNAPDKALIAQGVLRRADQVPEQDRHFAGDAVEFELETSGGERVGGFVIDEEVVHGLESSSSEEWLRIELGDVCLVLERT